MEDDDMSFFIQARDDCLQALQELSIIPTLVAAESAASGATLQETHGVLPTLRDILHHIQNYRAQDLTEMQLEMLLARKRHDFVHSYLVSLGDLGPREIRHEPGDAGTTKLFLKAKEFLDSFGLPYELVSGNHDLEGLDEFDTDKANLQAWMDCFDKPMPQFCRQIGQKTLLLGLSTVRFRDAPQSSHEVYVDDAQLEWFVQQVQAHPANEGWNILVFSHAPIAGSGLRVIQDVHVVNGCAWVNHCSEHTRSAFYQLVKENPQIVAWFNGHFHLSHDHQDAISTVGACTFVQVGVVGPGSTRDGRRQTRLVRGSGHRIQVYTINHHDRRDDNKCATVRLDVEINTKTGQVFRAPVDDSARNENWFQLYTPRENDDCYIESPNGSITRHFDTNKSHQNVRWWRMRDGQVIGLEKQKNQLVEYDRETLAPLGIVRDKHALGNRQVYVVENGTALVLVDNNNRTNIEVVHPNNDGSYFMNYQRNKRIRQEEKRREDIAKRWLEKHSTRENS